MDPRIEKHMRRLRDEFTEDIEYEASKRQSNYFGDESVEKLVRSTDDFEVLTTLYTVDEDSNFQQVFLKKPTRERHMRSVCVVFPASMTFRSIFDVFKEAGLKVISFEVTEEKFGENLSVDVEFSTRISVAVAVALTYSCRDLLPASCKVVAKLDVIHLDDYPLESFNRFKTVVLKYALPNAFKRRICVEFFHIPMTEDWLEKIFKAYGAIEYIKIITCGSSETPSRYAIVQFESCQSVRDVIRLNKKLMFTHKRVQVAMIINACDGTTL